MNESFNEILKSLGEVFGVEKMPEPKNGRVEFSVDDRFGAALFPVSAEDAGAETLVAVLFLGYPDHDNSALLTDLLEANYMGCGTGDGTLAIEARSGALVLHRVFNLPMDPDDFIEAFGRLLDAARYWSPRLTEPTETGCSSLDFVRI